MSYYELLGIPQQLALNPDDLQKRFHELSRQWHPDRFVRKPPAEQQHALDRSSQLNDAYRTLRDPIQRAEYVLKQGGLSITSTQPPPELLEEVFELNEAMDELRGGDASVKPQLEKAGRNFNAMLGEIDTELNTLFAGYDANPGPEALAPIRAVLNRRKYIQNLVNEVSKALAD